MASAIPKGGGGADRSAVKAEVRAVIRRASNAAVAVPREELRPLSGQRVDNQVWGPFALTVPSRSGSMNFAVF